MDHLILVLLQKKRCSDYSQLEYTVNKVLITGALTKNTTTMGTGQDGKKLVQGCNVM